MRLKIADYITLGNVVAGIISIYFSIQGDFIAAAIAIIAGVGFDYFDGKVARFLKQESELGAQLDSFADAITFGLAIALMLFLKFEVPYFGIILIFFVLCGIYRLARYNITSAKESSVTTHFEGTPITVNGIVFPLLVILDVNFYIVLGLVILLSITMVSKIRIRHL